jgi:hypothetical protein
MFARSVVTVIAMALMPCTPAVAAGKTPDRAIVALGKLSAADLSVLQPRGNAFLDLLHPGHPEDCGPSESGNLDFDRACMWSATAADDDFDLLVGIDNESIVSVATAWPRQLPASIWACEPLMPDYAPGDMMVCSVRSASEQSRHHWAESWRTFVNSIG